MQNLKIDNLLGVWKSDDYILTILPTRIVLSGNSTRGIDENIIMNYIADNNEYHNTIQVSDSINLFQLLTDNEIVLKLKNIKGQPNLVSEVFNRGGFENEFSFYQNIEVANKYNAVRWYNPWEYTILLEICNYSITKIISGSNEEGKSIISSFINQESQDISKWIKVNFQSHFIYSRQKDLIKKMQEALIEKQK